MRAPPRSAHPGSEALLPTSVLVIATVRCNRLLDSAQAGPSSQPSQATTSSPHATHPAPRPLSLRRPDSHRPTLALTPTSPCLLRNALCSKDATLPPTSAATIAPPWDPPAHTPGPYPSVWLAAARHQAASPRIPGPLACHQRQACRGRHHLPGLATRVAIACRSEGSRVGHTRFQVPELDAAVSSGLRHTARGPRSLATRTYAAAADQARHATPRSHSPPFTPQQQQQAAGPLARVSDLDS